MQPFPSAGVDVYVRSRRLCRTATCALSFKHKRSIPWGVHLFPIDHGEKLLFVFFVHKGHSYLFVVDYYSRDGEICLVSISVKTAENIDSANEESVVFCGHGICDSFITALNLHPNKLRRNRLRICVILIFSGQKPCENNLNNIAFFFTLFNDFLIEV